MDVEHQIPAGLYHLGEVKVRSIDVEGVVVEEIVDEGADAPSDVTDVTTGAEGGVVCDYCRGVEPREVRETEGEYLKVSKKERKYNT